LGVSKLGASKIFIPAALTGGFFMFAGFVTEAPSRWHFSSVDPHSC
jgi:hypothetical protein